MAREEAESSSKTSKVVPLSMGVEGKARFVGKPDILQVDGKD